MTAYSKEFKEKIIKKMLPPENKKVVDLAKEYKIHEQTLYRWKRQAKSKGIVYQDGKKSKEKYSREMQLQIIIETSSMNNQELSEYCRRKGLYVEEIESWKKAIINGETDNEKKIKSELKQKDKELKETKKELNRKEKALAEAAALLVLEKKIQAIWQSDEEN
jgi:transposase-like protein